MDTEKLRMEITLTVTDNEERGMKRREEPWTGVQLYGPASVPLSSGLMWGSS